MYNNAMRSGEDLEFITNIESLRQLEMAVRQPAPEVTETILYGGTGSTGNRYIEYFRRAGMPVVSLIGTRSWNDISSKTQSECAGATYHRASPNTPVDVDLVADLQDKHPRAAIVFMTPQHLHAETFVQIAPLVAERNIPVWIDKPLALDTDEGVMILNTIQKYPTLAHRIMSGGYTIEKGLALLLTTRAMDMSHPGKNYIQPLDDATPSFDSFLQNRDELLEQLGELTNISFRFLERRPAVREIIPDRAHLAFYSKDRKGGMVGDLSEHTTEALIRQRLIDPYMSKMTGVDLRYNSFYDPKVSIPWQYPKGDETVLADIEGSVDLRTLINDRTIPIHLSWGKRGPTEVDDRKLVAQYSDGTMTMEYRSGTAEEKVPNRFSIDLSNGNSYKYGMFAEPYELMLHRFKSLWSGRMQGESGLLAQLTHAGLQDDIRNMWMGKPNRVFMTDAPKSRQSHQTDEYRAFQDEEQRKIEQYLRSLQKI
jgi:hypothetical protein